MKNLKNNFTRFLTGLVLMAGIIAATTLMVSADDLTVNIGVIGECSSTVNGSNSSTANVASGSVTITVQNSDIFIGQQISGGGVSSSIDKGSSNSSSSATINLESVTSQTVLTFTPVPADGSSEGVDNFCPTGSNPIPSTLILNPSATTTSPGATGQNSTTEDKDKDKTTSKEYDEKDEKKKSDSKEESSSNNSNTTPEKSNSKVLIITLVSGLAIVLAVLIYLFKIKKLKFRSFKDIRRR